MRHPFRLLAAFMFCAGILPGAIRAKDAPTAADISSVLAVIAAQMNAFKRDDGEAAFSFAAPGIKEMFHTPEIFIEMVLQQYAPVYRPHYVEYLEPIAVGNQFM